MVKRIRWNEAMVGTLVEQALKKSSVVLSTTDTVLGLLAPLTKKGYDALGNIKQRNEKPYLIIIADKNDVHYFVTKKEAQRVAALIEAFWPGPLTIILKGRANLPKWLKGSAGTVALRLPKHEKLRAVARSFKGLFSTSANTTGLPVPHTFADVEDRIAAQCGLIILDEQTQAHETPSTIIDASGRVLRLVREGAIKKEQIQKIIPVA